MEKQRSEESERRSQEVRRSEKRRVRRKKMQVREKVGKSRFIALFKWFVALEGRKVGSLKAAGAKPAGQMRDEKRCGAKHISKSKCIKHTRVGPLLEVQMSKKCTSLWRKAHFQLKMYKTPHARTTFDASYVVFRGRRKGLRTLLKNVQNVRVLSQFQLQLQLQYATLRYATLHYTTLRHSTLHYTTVHYTTLHQLRYTTLH